MTLLFYSDLICCKREKLSREKAWFHLTSVEEISLRALNDVFGQYDSNQCRSISLHLSCCLCGTSTQIKKKTNDMKRQKKQLCCCVSNDPGFSVHSVIACNRCWTNSPVPRVSISRRKGVKVQSVTRRGGSSVCG